MRGLARLAWLQNRVLTGYLGVGLALLSFLLAAPIGPIKDGVLQFVQDSPFLQKMIAALMGMDLGGALTVKLLVGGTWGHPFLLACMLGFAIVSAARFPAQEVEQGHIDLLLSAPVGRSRVLLAHVIVAWACLGLLHLITLGAFWLGCVPLGADAPRVTEMFPLAGSLFITAIWMHSAATLLSCRGSTRAAVAGPLIAFGLWSMVVGYLRPFVHAAEVVAPLGLLHYYRPGTIMQSGLEWWGPTVLLGCSAMFYGLAFRVVRERDLV